MRSGMFYVAVPDSASITVRLIESKGGTRIEASVTSSLISGFNDLRRRSLAASAFWTSSISVRDTSADITHVASRPDDAVSFEISTDAPNASIRALRSADLSCASPAAAFDISTATSCSPR